MAEKIPNILPHNDDGSVDKIEAERIKSELLHKFLTESRAAERDNSFHVSRTGKRDIVVHLAVTILPDVDGHRVIGEKEREVNQFCFRIPASRLPMSNAHAIRAFSELAMCGKKEMMKIGVIHE